MNSGVHRKLDYADYAAIPDDGKRYEVLEGSLFVTPAPSPLHQRVSKRLQRQLEAYFDYAALGVPHFWLVDAESQRLECYRARAGTFELVGTFDGSAAFSHPDWPDLAPDLSALWR